MKLSIRDGLKTEIDKRPSAVAVRHKGLEFLLPIVQRQIAVLMANEKRIKELLNG